MKLRNKLFKRLNSSAILVIFTMAIFLILSCSGDDDGGGFVPAPDGSTPTPEDSTQTTFSMTEYFPLSSGWVTDDYTLFIDADDHQVTSGEVAKAMVDTRLPSIMYWTNDDRGLLLHELTDLSENKLIFTSTPPIKFADATCKVGDKQEGTVTIKADGEPEKTINYLIEVLGVEEVTTPAGTFSGCLKLQLKAWGPDVLPDLVPAEFLWFAQNVGFVKAQHENLPAGADTDETGLELFADAGEMRQLVSYHITPELEAPEVEAIKDNEALFQKALENEDVDATMALTDDQYYDRCRDKQQWRGAMTSWFETITDFKNYQTGVDTLFNAAGDEAAKFRESLQTSQSNDLSELNKEWNFKTRRYNKSGGEWLYLGSPIEVTPESAGGWAMVYVRKLPDNIGLAMSVGLGDCSTGQRINTPDRIKSLKVTGPPGSLITDYDLKADWDSTYEEFYNQFDLSNDINNIASGLYTFELVDQRDNVYEFSRYMGQPIELPIPVQRAPDLSNPSGVNFLWDPIVNDPEISFYRVEVFDSDTESRVVNINTTNNSQFVEFGNGQNQIPPGGNYTWRVRARYFDMYGYTLSESRCNLIPLVLN